MASASVSTLSFCPYFPQWWTMSYWWNDLFLHQVAIGCGVYHSNRNRMHIHIHNTNTQYSLLVYWLQRQREELYDLKSVLYFCRATRRGSILFSSASKPAGAWLCRLWQSWVCSCLYVSPTAGWGQYARQSYLDRRRVWPTLTHLSVEDRGASLQRVYSGCCPPIL